MASWRTYTNNRKPGLSFLYKFAHDLRSRFFALGLTSCNERLQQPWSTYATLAENCTCIVATESIMRLMRPPCSVAKSDRKPSIVVGHAPRCQSHLGRAAAEHSQYDMLLRRSILMISNSMRASQMQRILLRIFAYIHTRTCARGAGRTPVRVLYLLMREDSALAHSFVFKESSGAERRRTQCLRQAQSGCEGRKFTGAGARTHHGSKSLTAKARHSCT